MYVEFLGRERRRVKRCYLVSFSALVVLEQLHIIMVCKLVVYVNSLVVTTPYCRSCEQDMKNRSSVQ